MANWRLLAYLHWKMIHLCHLLNGRDVIEQEISDEIARKCGYAHCKSLFSALDRLTFEGRYVDKFNFWIGYSYEQAYRWEEEFFYEDTGFFKGMFGIKKIGETADVLRTINEIRSSSTLVSLLYSLRSSMRQVKTNGRIPSGIELFQDVQYEQERGKDLIGMYEHFFELMRDCGVLAPVGKSKVGFLGKVWSFDQKRFKRVLWLVHEPLECYLPAKSGK